jgi:DNA ligase D-like protein (predicted ligase)
VTAALDALDEVERERLRAAGPPKGSDTMKATLTDERFDDPAWIFERKLDGIRCLAVRDGGGVRLLSRNDLSLNGRYPELAAALQQQSTERFAVDGEVVAFEGRQTSFARLAQRGQRAVPVFLYVFDVLWLDGYDVRGLPLLTRKRLLRRTLSFTDGLRWTAYRREHGRAFYAQACRSGWEGLIAKRAASVYTDRRSRDWLKFKCEHGQELVVGGYTEPHGSRAEFGALLLGYYDAAGALHYAGKVGTGFDHVLLREIGRRLRALEQAHPPFAGAAAIGTLKGTPHDGGQAGERGVHWVAPELVAQVAFTEWTSAGRLRHPRFLGLRDDKPARDVVREG